MPIAEECSRQEREIKEIVKAKLMGMDRRLLVQLLLTTLTKNELWALSGKQREPLSP
jgi:hypothetical protein